MIGALSTVRLTWISVTSTSGRMVWSSWIRTAGGSEFFARGARREYAPPRSELRPAARLGGRGFSLTAADPVDGDPVGRCGGIAVLRCGVVGGTERQRRTDCIWIEWPLPHYLRGACPERGQTERHLSNLIGRTEKISSRRRLERGRVYKSNVENESDASGLSGATRWNYSDRRSPGSARS